MISVSPYPPTPSPYHSSFEAQQNEPPFLGGGGGRKSTRIEVAD